MRPSVLTVVVTFNAGPYIVHCLESLRASSVETQVIHVDNGSTDGTTELIQSRFPDMELIQSTKNMGFGKANNIGVRNALAEGFDYTFLLNQDAWIQNDTLSKLISFHKGHPQYGILSPLHLNEKGTAIDPKFSRNQPKVTFDENLCAQFFQGVGFDLFQHTVGDAGQTGKIRQ